MASYIPDFSNHRVQLIATAIASGVTVASLLLGYQTLEREERLSELKNSIPSLTDGHKVQRVRALPRSSKPHADTHQINSFGASETQSPADKEDARSLALARRAQAGDFDEDLILEQLARNRVFLGDDGLAKLRSAFIVVVGCGGVGSHCAASLARSGVSKLRLIDFDQVSLSSLNRHAVATLADVGVSKVQCLQKRLQAIAPWVKFDLKQEKYDDQVAKVLLGEWNGQKPDFVIDAIDNIDTKVDLLRFCHENELPVISSMGAGCKSDPTRIIVGDISATIDDGLSRATRRRLKLQGVTSGITSVFSVEKSGNGKAELLPLPDEEFEKGTVGDLAAMPNFRVRILPVLGTMPAVFGLTVANHVILSITGYPIEYVPAKGRDKMYEGVFNYVQGFEERIAKIYHPGLIGLKMPLTPTDVAFLVDDLYNGRSIISRVSTRLVLVRWRKPEDSVSFLGKEGDKEYQKTSNFKFSDLVCLTKEEAVRHEREIFKGDKKVEDLYDAETIEKVESKRKEIEAYERYR